MIKRTDDGPSARVLNRLSDHWLDRFIGVLMTARRVMGDSRWRSLRRLALVAGAVAATGVVARILIAVASATSGSDDDPFSSFIRTANGFRIAQSTLESSPQADEASDEDGASDDKAAPEDEWDY